MKNIITLKSGLRVCFQRKAGTRALAIGVFVGAGSAYEDKKSGGIAHFLEHLMFKGTKKRSAYEIAFEIEKRGININAFTSKTYTCYYTVGLTDFIDECMDILSDMYFNSTFLDENIEKEKGVVLEEINMYKDDGEDLCMEKLNEIFYGKNPLALPILGTARSVKKYTRDDLCRFTERFYTPKNTVIALSGNVDEAKVLSLIEKYFESNFDNVEFDAPKKLKRATHTSKYIFTKKDDEQSCVCLRFPSYYSGHKKEYAPALLATILGGGMSSRLFQAVREELGLVYEINAGITHYINNGTFDIFLATSPQQVCEAVSAIRLVLDDIKKNGVTEEEFTKARTQYITSLTMSGENSADTMRIAGKSLITLGKLITSKKCIEKVEKITLADINEAVSSILDYNKACMSYVGKETECGDLLKVFKAD